MKVWDGVEREGVDGGHPEVGLGGRPGGLVAVPRLEDDDGDGCHERLEGDNQCESEGVSHG